MRQVCFKESGGNRITKLSEKSIIYSILYKYKHTLNVYAAFS